VNYVLLMFKFAQLVLGIVHTVHEVQESMPGAPGAEKSQAVIDKVSPIADALNANAPAIQAAIDGVVSLAKAVGTIKRDAPATLAMDGEGIPSPQTASAAAQTAP
jgi:hypothetical protein